MAAVLLAGMGLALAQPAELQRVEVRSGAAAADMRELPSAVTVIDRAGIERAPVGIDYTDLLRRVPGINAYRYGQGDIGSPIKMRGFTGTGAHGGDGAILVDGVPQNVPSTTQGGPDMSDLSWLTPAKIEHDLSGPGPDFNDNWGLKLWSWGLFAQSRWHTTSTLTLGASWGHVRGRVLNPQPPHDLSLTLAYRF